MFMDRKTPYQKDIITTSSRFIYYIKVLANFKQDLFVLWNLSN